MAPENFAVDLDDGVYQAALRRAQSEGKSIEQILLDLLTGYGQAGNGVTTYTVRRGDSLSRIARRFYGDPYKYTIIQNANKIPPPGQIWVGQVLVIPALSGAEPAPAPMPAPPPRPAPMPAPPPAPTPAPPPTPSPSPQPPPAPPPPSPSPGPPAGATLADYVRAMPRSLRPDRAIGLRATYHFQITGGGAWTVSVANQRATVTEGASGSPTVTIQISQEDYIKLAQGKLNAIQAFRQGQIRIDGDLNVAAKIPDIFGPWEDDIEVGSPPQPTPGPSPTPQPQPKPQPSPQPSPGPANPRLLNASFDEYQPYHRDDEDKVWKEPQFPERYAKNWTLEVIDEHKGRIHVMDSGTYGKFSQKYYGGSGLNYSPHSGKYSQVIASRYGYDLVLRQTVAAQPGRDYKFKASIVSFYKGTGGERADGKVFKQIGLDPTGGTKWDNSAIVWSERDGKDNEWRYPEVRAKAQGNAVTLYFRIKNDERDVGETELNLVYIDDCQLE